MHDHLILLVVGVPVFLALCTWGCLAALAAGKAADAREEADYARLRSPGMGDLRSVPDEPSERERVVAETWARREAEERAWCLACKPENGGKA